MSLAKTDAGIKWWICIMNGSEDIRQLRTMYGVMNSMQYTDCFSHFWNMVTWMGNEAEVTGIDSIYTLVLSPL